MVSLCILGALLLAMIVSNGWALAWTARRVGSTRGRFVVGVLAACALLALNIGIAVGSSFVTVESTEALLGINVGLLLVQLAAAFLIIRTAFALSAKRAFAPFAALFVMAAIHIAFMLLVLRPYLVESMVIPTEALEPTIEAGSRVFVNKIIEPRRLDFVTYWNHDKEPLIYCKRLIGLPGERLRFENGGIFINDKPVELPPAIAGRCHASLPGWRDGPRYRDGETIVLANDEYFFVGDNLERSLDSRIVGPTKQSSLVGVVDLIRWPWHKAAVMR